MLLFEIDSSARAIDVLIPTPNSLESLSSKFSLFWGSSERPLLDKKSNLVSVDACIERIFTLPIFYKN